MSERDTSLTPLDPAEPRNLGELLARIAAVAAETERLDLGRIIDALGTRSFGPFLLLIGVLLVSPLSGIPGVPTTMGIALVLTSLQLLFGRKVFWLPRWLLSRSVSTDRLLRALNSLQRPARYVDWFLRPRLSFLVANGGTIGIALTCVMLGLMMPVMEVVPFSATAAGLSVVLFGLAMVSFDGVFVLLAVAYLVSVGCLALGGLA
ncbi:MAG: exopolysaccharide biosynthesis protein [Guyparkeria sp.]|uniref:exopolysaccharide biosynthesis protein n=1 Tax=Guyparkeria sp. TaxID=2035736 RepID=UPI003979989E